MPTHKTVRRISDGVIFEAVKYGEDDGSWSQECITRVAAFTLGLNPDVSTSAQNERILDIITPIKENFDPENRVADIEVSDWAGDHIFKMKLGDWILKNPITPFIVVKPQEFMYDYEYISDISVPTRTDSNKVTNLAAFIYNECFTMRGTLFQTMADTTAKKLIRAGWSKKEPS